MISQKSYEDITLQKQASYEDSSNHSQRKSEVGNSQKAVSKSGKSSKPNSLANQFLENLQKKSSKPNPSI
jgi:hypothetical protein